MEPFRRSSLAGITAMAGLVVLCSATPARAFNLGDHKRITLEAVSELNHCFPGLIQDDQQLTLWVSDLDEDIDYFRKSIFSHYFNPYKHLDMVRFDSSVRVARLQSALLDDATQGDTNSLMVFAHLGHAIHMIQDASSPPHVVPVAHGLNDGFESYAFSGSISSGLECADLLDARAPDLNTLLVATAEATLDQVAAIRLQVFANGKPETLSGDAFWQQSSDNSFGHYGIFGNSFGKSFFGDSQMEYAIPDANEFYSSFKQQQMELAVRSSVRALYWYLVTMNPSSQKR